MAENIITSEFRVSFPHLFEPATAQGSTQAKYSVSMLFPLRSTLTGKALEDYDRFKAALDKAVVEAAKEKWGDKIPKGLKDPRLDQGDHEYEGYEKGALLLRVSSIQAPGIVDAKVQKIIDSSEIYPGCYGKASIRAYAYEKNGNRGISFGLGNFQKTRDGESLGGRTRAEDDFAPVGGGDTDNAGSAPAESADSIFG